MVNMSSLPELTHLCFVASIDIQPMATNAELGTTITLSVAVTGYNLFEWYKDGVPVSDGGWISGAETETLTITNAMTSDTGSYFILVSALGVVGTVQSDEAFVRVACK